MALILTLTVVAIGLVAAFSLGKSGSKGFWATGGILFVDVLLGIALAFAVFCGAAACYMLKKCTDTDDSVWVFIYPLIAIPGYWIATLVGKLYAKTDDTSGRSHL